jgi:hypothetical protein
MRRMRITPICSICNKPIDLETSKTDERGQAVHEECYLRIVKQPPRLPVQKSVSMAVIDFLTAASLPKKEDACCPECGSPIGYRTLTFFFRGQTWNVRLPLCPACNLISPCRAACDC